MWSYYIYLQVPPLGSSVCVVEISFNDVKLTFERQLTAYLYPNVSLGI